MFNKLLEAIDIAKQKDFDEQCFDMMLEDFDFDEELSEGFFSNLKAKREARIKEDERRCLEAHEESNRLRAKFRSRVPSELRKYLDMDNIKDSDTENETIFSFNIPYDKLGNEKSHFLYNKIEQFAKQIEASSKSRIWTHSDDEYYDIRVDSNTSFLARRNERLQAKLKESDDFEDIRALDEAEAFANADNARKLAHIEANKLRSRFSGRIPTDLRRYLDMGRVNINDENNTIIFNFNIPDEVINNQPVYNKLMSQIQKIMDQMATSNFDLHSTLRGNNHVLKVKARKRNIVDKE